MKKLLILFWTVAPLLSHAQNLAVETMLLTGHGFYAPDPGSEPFVGKKVPNFNLETFDGKRVSSESLRGRVVVLDFWATWYGWCKRLTADLEREVARHRDPRTVVLGVNCKETDFQAAVAYWNDAGYSFAALRDGDELGRMLKACHPTVVVVDASGVVRYLSNGWSEYKAREVALLVDYLHGDLEVSTQAVRRALEKGDGVKALFVVDLLIGRDPASETSLCPLRIQALEQIKHPEKERYVEQVKARYPGVTSRM